MKIFHQRLLITPRNAKIRAFLKIFDFFRKILYETLPQFTDRKNLTFHIGKMLFSKEVFAVFKRFLTTTASTAVYYNNIIQAHKKAADGFSTAEKRAQLKKK